MSSMIPVIPMPSFPDRLRELRTQKKMTQKELANLFKLSESTIGMYERGEREPSLEQLGAFADFFGVSLDYLVGKTNNPSRESVLTTDLIEFLEKSDELHIGGQPLNPRKKKIVLDFLKEVFMNQEDQDK